ncbi:MAG: DinB family protein [Flavisolibacter sp.]
MTNVDLSRIPEYYHKYVSLAIHDDIDTAFDKHQEELVSFLKGVPKKKWNYRYAEGKWSIKEVVQHIIDAERVFAYRALCFARKDQTPLPSFDENLFATNSKAEERTKKDLLKELETVQRSSAQLFKSFDEEQLEQPGVASGKSVYVRGVGYILLGHAIHHRNILQERYLK